MFRDWEEKSETKLTASAWKQDLLMRLVLAFFPKTSCRLKALDQISFLSSFCLSAICLACCSKIMSSLKIFACFVVSDLNKRSFDTFVCAS